MENGQKRQLSGDALPYNGIPSINISQGADPNGGQPAHNNNGTYYGGATYDPQRFDPYYNTQQSSAIQGSLPHTQNPYSSGNQPSTAFGAFNLPLWNPADANLNNSSTEIPSMPFMNPQFFMNNTQSFPMMPFNSMFPFPGAQPMSTLAGASGQTPDLLAPDPQRQRSKTPPMTIPTASEAYMHRALQPPLRTPKRPLLIILDLNGTLIFRKHRKFPPVFAERHGLREFLEELCRKHSVMIWTSSKPQTLNAIAKTLFPTTSKKESKLVACWGRDKFGLTQRQYNAKLQVYKELKKVWDTPEIQEAYPGNGGKSKGGTGGKFSKKQKQKQNKRQPYYPEGQRWDQTNTILIDDSKIKALSEPYNILEIPEFTNNPNVDETMLFRRVLDRLDALSHHDDVSKVFRVWEERQTTQNCKVLDLDINSEMPEGLEDDIDVSEDGGAKLPSTSTNLAQGEASGASQKGQPQFRSDAEKKAAKKAKKAEKKANKREKKALEDAAKANAGSIPQGSAPAVAPTASIGGTPDALPSASAATAVAQSSNPPSQALPKLSRNEARKAAKQRKKAEREQMKQQEILKELDPNVSTTLDNPEAPRYSVRSKGLIPSVSDPVPVDATSLGDPSTAAAAAMDPLNVSSSSVAVTNPDFSNALHSAEQSPGFQFNPRQRSFSPARSDVSRNSMLDRLEEGLGLKK
ncbi:hypothetical protein N7478_005375 [Penicillium angulare]|uniref:uncharacterized protein n=1 Tax=Penicillium angulare TaxID=116970 RepID=UPI0025424879|nr:uncharacterized protein N7478_005375 [Penicillium angulare]KAJ5280003.1 hypothetical protein N7478_005375 [Penicillium angulare]